MSDTSLTITEMKQQATTLANSGMFAVRSPQQAYVQILAGQELGIPPFAAMNQIQIVKGRPELGAHALAGLVKRSGRYNYRIRNHDDTECHVEFYERWDDKWESVGTSSFTVDDAKRAGLLRNPVWKSYPRNMLYARAMSNGVKWFCPDIVHGAVYHTGEISSEPTRTVEVVDVMPVAPKRTKKQQSATWAKSNKRLHAMIGRLVKLVPDGDNTDLSGLRDYVTTVCHRLAREMCDLDADAQWSSVDEDAIVAVGARIEALGKAAASVEETDRQDLIGRTMGSWMAAL